MQSMKGQYVPLDQEKEELVPKARKNLLRRGPCQVLLLGLTVVIAISCAAAFIIRQGMTKVEPVEKRGAGLLFL